MLDESTPEGAYGVSKRERQVFAKWAKGHEMAEDGMRKRREQMAKLRAQRLAHEASGGGPVGEWEGPVRIAGPHSTR